METTEAVKTKWVSDPTHSEITFKVKHLMITNVNGEFRKFKAEIDGEDFLTSPVKVSIEGSSIFTNSDDRDAHLKGAEFFDVEKHEQLIFESTRMKKLDDENFQLTGLLTIKGVSNEVKLNVEYGGINTDPYGNEKAGFSVSGTINRKDWGLNWNAGLEAGGVLVSDEVKIAAEIQFVRSA